MLSKALELFIGWLKSQRYWATIEPFFIIALAWVGAQLLSFEWIGTRTAFKPSFRLFLDSYLSHWITIGALGLAALILLFRSRPGIPARESASHLRMFWSANRRLILYRTGGTLLILAVVALGFRRYAPSQVSHITVRFMDLDSDITPEGLAYLIYEINRLQRNWYFEIDFAPFNPEEFSSDQATRCQDDSRPKLCQAEILAEGRPFIGITAQSLGGAYFAEHRGAVSVITTAEQSVYAPLTSYEYLAYCLILQAMSIHLDADGSLPQDAFDSARLTHGGFFQFVPYKQAVKSSILAARLTPEEEMLLLNRFGRDYVATCADLLTMNWLYSDRVKGNFEHVFKTKLER